MPWCWCFYKFEKNLFPKRSDFKLWMTESGFIFDEDFKNVEKLENDPENKHVKVQMKDTTFNSINGMEYDGKKVHFMPLQ
mgnify:CR=1 FL=1